MSKEIGIDLETSNTLIYIKGKGIVLSEPTVVAMNSVSNNVLAVGSEAKNMIGRTPKNIVIFRPLRNVVITDFDITQHLLKSFIKKIITNNFLINLKITVSYPLGITEVEKTAFTQVVNQAVNQVGVHKVTLVEQPLAAAIGSDLHVNEPIGHVIVDIGGGITEVAAISLGGIVVSKSLRVTGNDLDEAIICYVKREFNLLIGENTAEKIKIELGYGTESEETSMEVIGRDLFTRLPKVITITEGQIKDALKASVALIIGIIKTTIKGLEPGLSGDIIDGGIMLTGGGALLKGLDKLIYSETHIPTHIVEFPFNCVAIGAGKYLDRYLSK